MPKLKILFVFNNNNWTTVQEKISSIKNFFASKVDLVCDVKYTKFTDIPFEKVSGIDGTGSQDGHDTVITTETVKDSWYNENLSIPNSAYDIIVFCISENDKVGHITSSGIRSDKDQGPVETTIFGGNEFYRCYVNGVDIGNNFVIFACHEISHAMYMILAKSPDNTHVSFYSGRPQLVLNDFDFSKPRTVDKNGIIQRLLAAMYQLLGIYQKQLTQIESISKEDKIYKFCMAIQDREGYIAPNAKYPLGTPAWKNKNPGNLKFAGQEGAIGKDSNGFAIFKTYEAGLAALQRQILMACNGTSNVFKPTFTVLEFFQKYAPSTDNNDPFSYALEVAQKVGVNINVQMKDLL